jgi:hypothetical protein
MWYRSREGSYMKRRLFTLLSALSLLLFVAVVVLWVRSYRLTDSLAWPGDDGWRSVGSASGYMVLQLNSEDAPPRTANDGWPRYQRMGAYTAPHYAVAYGPVRPGDAFVDWELGDAGWYTVRNVNGVRSVTGVAPFWCIALATALPPLSWLGVRLRSHVRQRRERRPGLCPSCGYDLRATPDRCPECGRAAAQRTNPPVAHP